MNVVSLLNNYLGKENDDVQEEKLNRLHDAIKLRRLKEKEAEKQTKNIANFAKLDIATDPCMLIFAW